MVTVRFKSSAVLAPGHFVRCSSSWEGRPLLHQGHIGVLFQSNCGEEFDVKDNSKLFSHRKEEFSRGQFQCEKQDLFRKEVSCFRKRGWGGRSKGGKTWENDASVVFYAPSHWGGQINQRVEWKLIHNGQWSYLVRCSKQKGYPKGVTGHLFAFAVTITQRWGLIFWFCPLISLKRTDLEYGLGKHLAEQDTIFSKSNFTKGLRP